MDGTLRTMNVKIFSFIFLAAFSISLIVVLHVQVYQHENWSLTQTEKTNHNKTQTSEKLVEIERTKYEKSFPAFKSMREVKRNRVKRGSNRINLKNKGCHLVGAPQPQSSVSYFLWARPKRTSQLSTCFFNIKKEGRNLIRNIVIPKNGYYLVYAQVTFCGMGMTNPGFETVVYDSDTNRYRTLLKTAIKQDQISGDCIRDSKYHSGYFYLLQDEYLEVRQIISNVGAFTFDKGLAYFGIIFMFSEN